MTPPTNPPTSPRLTETTHEPLAGGFDYRASRLARKLTWLVDQALAPHGVTAAQRCILLACAEQPRIRPVELGEELGLSRAAVTRVLQRLEEKGLLERRVDPTSRRSQLVELTETGEELVDRLRELSRRLDEHVLQVLDGDERESFDALFDRVLGHIDHLVRRGLPLS